MSNNTIRSAFELVDAEPSNEFLSSLRASLLADFTRSDTAGSQGPNALPLESGEEYIALAPNPSRLFPSGRLSRTLLAAAACVAVFATGAVIVSRAGHYPNATTDLHEVNRQLAQHTLITPGALDTEWTSGYSWGDFEFPTQATAMIAALPDCTLLRSVGLLPPTTKSATAHQFVPGTNFLFQEVFVFATPEDASLAMDVIAGAHQQNGDLFSMCWFNLFDRLTPFNVGGWTSTTEAWQPSQLGLPLDPTVTPHGDRQVIIGQHTTFVRPAGRLERYFFNAFVQVGRTITWINPRWLSLQDTATSDPAARAVGVNEAITAAANALKN